jgi:hypothetical protein
MESIAVYLKMSDAEKAEKYVNSQYLCKKKLGSGGFGEVWSCLDLKSLSESDKHNPDEHTYAMKIENL